MKKLLLLIPIVAMTLFAGGEKVSKYMSQVFNEGRGFDIQVSSVMYKHTQTHRYTPLIVQVHNWTEPDLRVSVNAFTLVDDKGNTFSPISSEDFLENHRVQGRRNYKYLSRRGDNGIETKPSIWYIERTNFYPSSFAGGRGGAVRSVSVKANFYCIDWLYFDSLPPGNYTLQFDAGGETLSMPVFL